MTKLLKYIVLLSVCCDKSLYVYKVIDRKAEYFLCVGRKVLDNSWYRAFRLLKGETAVL